MRHAEPLDVTLEHQRHLPNTKTNTHGAQTQTHSWTGYHNRGEKLGLHYTQKRECDFIFHYLSSKILHI